MKAVLLEDIQPFIFPTSTWLVDDDESYLQVLPLLLDSALHYQAFSSPRLALEVLSREGNRSASRIHRLATPLTVDQRGTDLDVKHLHNIAYDTERFEEVSVVVVDYFMGGDLNGIEFCRALENLPIGRILLTGRANDDKVAQALQAGTIDQFIPKHDNEVFIKLSAAIRELRYRYFVKINTSFFEFLANARFEFLRDPIFQSEFHSAVSRMRAVEYYLCEHPTGLLLIDANGKGNFLWVQNEVDLLDQYQMALGQNAPETLLSALRAGVAMLWQEANQSEMSFVQSIPVPAFRICSDGHTYFYSIIENPSFIPWARVKSYNTWLDEKGDLIIRSD